MMKRILLSLVLMVSAITIQAKTLVVYYSYTNNVRTIVDELTKQIGADVVRIEPAEKGLDYAANNYAIGSAQISAIRNNPNNAASYPAIDPVKINLADYDTILIGAPLWWSSMAPPLQTYLFNNGKSMAGKKIGLIVSSASSGISGVEMDAKRLIPDGDFLSPSLWIRSSQTSNAANLITQWLKKINYDSLAGVNDIHLTKISERYTIFSISGEIVAKDVFSIKNLDKGIYIINGKKIFVK